MKKTKLGLAALTTIICGIAAMAARPSTSNTRFTSKFFGYIGASGIAASYNNPNKYALLSSRNSCTSGNTLCQIFALATTVYGESPQIPAGFGTAIAAYDNNGTKSVAPTSYSGVSVYFITP